MTKPQESAGIDASPSEGPQRLIGFADYELEEMLEKQTGLTAAALREVLLLRQEVRELGKRHR